MNLRDKIEHTQWQITYFRQESEKAKLDLIGYELLFEQVKALGLLCEQERMLLSNFRESATRIHQTAEVKFMAATLLLATLTKIEV